MLVMSLLLALVVFAMAPTGYFSWGDSRFENFPLDQKRRFMASPAICYLRPNSGTSGFWRWVVDWSPLTETGAFQSMVVSALLLLAGFSVRAVKMSRRLSRNVTTSIRRPVSRHAQRFLVIISTRNGDRGRQGMWERWWHVLIIQPCLALFISARLIADIYSSMFAEVSIRNLLCLCESKTC